ncbi:autotransporter assembly complex protein TamA [Imbroritus primus]|uniref:autotransporter assembly complex protein TamA n=1 Tax=Imbroritus primus TaxID=3058603 RepID=UPI003D161744
MTGRRCFSRRLRKRALLLLALPSLWAAGPAAAYRVEIEAPPELADMLKTHLDISRYREREDISVDQFNYMVETVGDQVRRLASTEGYFDPKTTATVDAPLAAEATSEDLDARTVRVRVEAGARTLVTSVDVDFTGAIADEDRERLEALRRNWGLPAGQPFRQETWAKAKDDTLFALQSEKYYAARLTRSQARIDPEAQEAVLDARYDSGPAYTLGPLEITGLRRYPAQIIHNVNPLNEGEPYSVNRLLELQRAIQNQPYFSNVMVDLGDEPDPVNAPVKVRVREYPAHRVNAGVGYATDTGAQVEGRYSYFNLFNRAWVFDSQMRIEQRRQYAFAEIAMPPDEKTYRHSVYGSIDRTDLEGVDLRSWRVGVKRARTRERFDTAIALDLYYDDLRPETGARQLSKALVPSYSWTRRNVDDPLFPRRGNIINAQVGVAVSPLLTDQTFGRVYGRIRQYFPVGSRDLVIARGEVGAILTSGSSRNVPASLRFRAGGNDSVRGYGYQSIGQRDGASVLPTKFLVTGGLEYQYWFRREWGAAAFYDVGTATNNWPDRKLYHGIGFGARWRSPVGPVNVDLAYGVQDRRIRPHISLGVAF